ncbi:MAG: HoxN/HupN/NixA family nickel/cobalt transporter [Dyella sp.]
MLRSITTLWHGSAPDFRRKLIAIYAALILFNAGAWLWAFIAFHGQPVLLSTALLAYTFGLRHAVDADHIAAIDNVTRKLLQERRSALGVGPFFAIGHSTVIIVMSMAIAMAAISLSARFDQVKNYGSIISTSVSAFFLLLLAVANMTILVSVYKTFRSVRQGQPLIDEDLDLLLNKRGVLSRLFRPLFRLASRSWHMFPIGFLFGLGFDTATEIALFGISATQASHGLSFGALLCLPMLFTAGMTLIDTTDGVLMMGAYKWAFIRPIRKIYYNMMITFVSVVVAVVIGSVEALALAADKLALTGPFWGFISAAASHFGLLGYFVIGLFVLSWAVSAIIYRLKRYDDIEVNFSA